MDQLEYLADVIHQAYPGLSLTEGAFDTQSLARVGDPLADALYVHLAPFSKAAPVDILHVLDLDPTSAECRAHLRDGVDMSEWQKDRQAFLEQVHSVPAWVDKSQIHRAQLIYFKHVSDIIAATLYGGLIPGYSFPRMAKVLVKTGYLARQGQIITRLAETGYFTVSCMKSVDSLLPGGDGWKAAVRVRCLHASVRRRLSERQGTVVCPVTGGSGSCPVSASASSDVAINQADMAATLQAFCVIPMLHTFLRVSTLDHKMMEEFLHPWRYVGYVLGVLPEADVLAHGMQRALQFFYHYGKENFAPGDPSSVKLTTAVMTSLRKTTADDLQPHAEMVRLYCTKNLSDQLGLPPSDPKAKKKLEELMSFRRTTYDSIVTVLLCTPFYWIVVALQVVLLNYTIWKSRGDTKFMPKPFLTGERLVAAAATGRALPRLFLPVLIVAIAIAGSTVVF
ncbi:hypothetical protein HDV03_002026 [Kappamyces sp. JEL0829]|nr:hypothetical protein HDV03_002026 [Kappamyces sp. JEL0829]